MRPRLACAAFLAMLAVQREARAGGLPPALRIKHLSVVLRRTPAQQAELRALVERQQDPTSVDFHRWLSRAAFDERFGIDAAVIQEVADWLRARGLEIERVSPSGTRLSFEGSVGDIERAFEMKLRPGAWPASFEPAGPPRLPEAWGSRAVGILGLGDVRPHVRSLYEGLVGGVVQYLVAPRDLHAIYDFTPAFSDGYQGSGIRLGIVGQTWYLPADIAAFRGIAGLPDAQITNVQVPDTGDPNAIGEPNDLQESELDLEWAGAAAPEASLVFVYVGGAASHTYDDAQESSVFEALDQAVDTNAADIISVSYGLCESDAPPALIGDLSQTVEEANAMGITIVVASGDDGSSCDEGGTGTNFPASLPGVTAVGATQLSDTQGTWWSTKGNAVGYIPEIGWSDSAGGASSLFEKPTWQVGTGVPDDGQRDVPDVALDGSWDHDGYVACVNGGCDGGTFGEPATGAATPEWGGTSIAAPIVAGVLADLEESLGARPQGNVNPALYGLAAGASPVFHDITSGSNGAYSCGPGYDQVTGLGSLVVNELVPHFPVPSSTDLVFVSGTAVATVHGLPSASNLAGTVSLFLDGEEEGTATLVSGPPDASGPTSSATLILAPLSGSHVLLAVYGGNGNYTASSSNGVMLGGPAPVGPLQVSPTTARVAPRGAVTFTATGGAANAWSVSSNNSGASITTDGLYTAGPVGNTVDVVLVRDDAGDVAIATVNIGPAPPARQGCASSAPDWMGLLALWFSGRFRRGRSRWGNHPPSRRG